MTLFRYSILSVTIAAAIGAAGAATAADDPAKRDPTARHCTNDPDLASDLYEYLADCPAAQAVMNRASQWEAMERGAQPGTGRVDTMGTPGNPGGSSMRTPNAPGGTSTGTPGNPGGMSTGTPSNPGSSSMGTPSAPSGGKAN